MMCFKEGCVLPYLQPAIPKNTTTIALAYTKNIGGCGFVGVGDGQTLEKFDPFGFKFNPHLLSTCKTTT
jgi:hypothetical protein